MRERLETLYNLYNERCYVHPDPLTYLYQYPDPLEREVVALVAAGLAYGRVAQILKSVSTALDKMAPSPRDFLLTRSFDDMVVIFADFTHRFATGTHLAAMLAGAGALMRQYGSLRDCFLSGLSPADSTALPALSTFSRRLIAAAPEPPGHLIPCVEKASACKRLNLMLRWLVRHDAVDPGGWEAVSASRLIVPLDTHMHRMALGLGLTARRQADMKTALEITAAFARIRPEDPVRYDFVLTRSGIRGDAVVPCVLDAPEPEGE